MPSFGGSNIFGTAVSMSTADLPRVAQVNGYFGVSGVESLDGGARGRVTLVRGVLTGTSAGDLAAAEANFRSFHDGVARVLVDMFGNPWSNVRLDVFDPIGRVRQSPFGTFCRPYRARFLHLS